MKSAESRAVSASNLSLNLILPKRFPLSELLLEAHLVAAETKPVQIIHSSAAFCNHKNLPQKKFKLLLMLEHLNKYATIYSRITAFVAITDFTHLMQKT